MTPEEIVAEEIDKAWYAGVPLDESVRPVLVDIVAGKVDAETATRPMVLELEMLIDVFDRCEKRGQENRKGEAPEPPPAS